jgi:hypothetical protein
MGVIVQGICGLLGGIGLGLYLMQAQVISGNSKVGLVFPIVGLVLGVVVAVVRRRRRRARVVQA